MFQMFHGCGETLKGNTSNGSIESRCEHDYVTYQEFSSMQTVFVDFRKKIRDDIIKRFARTRP